MIESNIYLAMLVLSGFLPVLIGILSLLAFTLFEKLPMLHISSFHIADHIGEVALFPSLAFSTGCDFDILWPSLVSRML